MHLKDRSMQLPHEVSESALPAMLRPPHDGAEHCIRMRRAHAESQLQGAFPPRDRLFRFRAIRPADLTLSHTTFKFGLP
ncbi:hypothetical protein [Candidatus Burkholderia verschuerenii]|uniref:hypothetical protein n=1 Tax=Candidatus Burkholderia verschuerenii TaxID=242163 RepID=UPI0012EED222|nr:hypothetical protein [Candidatus Burkholderia verschuerenii]